MRHGPDLELRVLFEPMLVRHGVDVVFSGHDHVYERLTPQAGVSYFVTGAGGDGVRMLRSSKMTAASFDREQTFTAVEVSGAELRLEVANDGPGIPDQHLPHLFERFWQGEPGAGQGIGVGLSIAKAIVEAHGGRIGVHRMTGGNRFFFTLPRGHS